MTSLINLVLAVLCILLLWGSTLHHCTHFCIWIFCRARKIKMHVALQVSLLWVWQRAEVELTLSWNKGSMNWLEVLNFLILHFIVKMQGTYIWDLCYTTSLLVSKYFLYWLASIIYFISSILHVFVLILIHSLLKYKVQHLFLQYYNITHWNIY